MVVATRSGGQGRRQPRPYASEWDPLSAGALGIGLGAVVLALYPDNVEVSPVSSWFWPLFVLGVVLLVGYGWRQRRRTVLRSWRLLGTLLSNLLVGAGLMVVLVDVPVFARGIFDVDQGQAGVLLTFFLVGVPVGAALGGIVAAVVGRRFVAAVGMVGAVLGFWVLAGWDAASFGERWAGVRVVDLSLVGLGLAFGVVIAPVAGAALDATSRREHGLVSSLVVTARTVGMLLALSALTAFGLFRFRQLLAAQPQPPDSVSLHDKLKMLEANVTRALTLEYHDIFRLAAALCLAAGVVAVVTLGGRRPRAAGSG